MTNKPNNSESIVLDPLPKWAAVALRFSSNRSAIPASIIPLPALKHDPVS
jgi:hypothetical protein